MTVTIYTPVAPCIKNNAAGYSFTIALLSQADAKLFQDNPAMSLINNDFTKALDGVNGGALTNLPVAVAGNTRLVRVTLTQAEINCNEFSLLCHDFVGAQWCDLLVVINTVEAKAAGTSDLTLANITGSALFSGITSLANWLRGLYRKDAMNAAAKLEVNAGGGTYNETTDSNEALADAITAAAVFPAGAIEFTFTVTTPALIPIGGASVWISTDILAANIIWRGSTDAFGVARDVLNRKPWLDAGVYFFWVQDENYSGSNPTALVVS